MSPRYQVNISILSGAEFYQEFHLVGPDLYPLDLDEIEVRGAIAKHSTALDAIRSTSSVPVPNGHLFVSKVVDKHKGIISLYMSPSTTNKLEEGKYVYGVALMNENGDIIEPLSGVVFVDRAVGMMNVLEVSNELPVIDPPEVGNELPDNN